MTRAKGGPSPKAPGAAIDTRNGVRAILTTPGERFDPPASIEHPAALEAWEDYWRDPVSSLLTETDRPMLNRWVDSLQRYWVLMEKADAEPMLITAANGQVANGLYRVAAQMAMQAERMELRLGIGPKCRAALGIQIVEAGAAINKAKASNKKPPPPDVDPRVVPGHVETSQ